MIEVKPEQEQLLTCREVAQRLRVGEITVRRWIACGSLQAIALPHANKRASYRIKLSVLNAIVPEEK